MSQESSQSEEADEPVDEPGSPIVTPYLIAARIVAVLGMSFALAIGIFALLAGAVLPGIGIALLATPFFFLMRYVEARTPYGDDEPAAD
jgi:hypothetical protein